MRIKKRKVIKEKNVDIDGWFIMSLVFHGQKHNQSKRSRHKSARALYSRNGRPSLVYSDGQLMWLSICKKDPNGTLKQSFSPNHIRKMLMNNRFIFSK